VVKEKMTTLYDENLSDTVNVIKDKVVDTIDDVKVKINAYQEKNSAIKESDPLLRSNEPQTEISSEK
jgi:hypothetical protein